MEAVGFLIYLAVKSIAYVSWCGLGAKLHGHTDRIKLKAVIYGFLRLVLGAVLGLMVILWMINLVNPEIRNGLVAYLIVYVPVRWIEWSLMAFIMDQEHRTAVNFLAGETTKSRLWRLGGIGISCLADIPVLISIGGLPVGRFMC